MHVMRESGTYVVHSSSLKSGQQPINGANAIFADPLLDKMVGHWTMNGELMGRPTMPGVTFLGLPSVPNLPDLIRSCLSDSA
jgi:hypothetical protein